MENKLESKCGKDIELKIGDVEIDPCDYEEIDVIENCIVHILKCRKCGHIEIEWEKMKE